MSEVYPISTPACGPARLNATDGESTGWEACNAVRYSHCTSITVSIIAAAIRLKPA